MSDGDVVWLAWHNPRIVEDETVPLMACKACLNKTFRFEVYEECAARVYCAACNSYLGRMGWVPEPTSEAP